MGFCGRPLDHLIKGTLCLSTTGTTDFVFVKNYIIKKAKFCYRRNKTAGEEATPKIALDPFLILEAAKILAETQADIPGSLARRADIATILINRSFQEDIGVWKSQNFPLSYKEKIADLELQSGGNLFINIF